MRTLSRRIFNAIAGISLLAAVALAIAWSQSFPHAVSYRSLDFHWSSPRQRTSKLWSINTAFNTFKFWSEECRWTPASWDEGLHPSPIPVSSGGILNRLPVDYKGFASEGLNFTYVDYAQTSFSRRLGFAFHSQTMNFAPRTQHNWGFELPMWFALTILAIPPLIWLRLSYHRRRLHLRRERGQCAKCGYDLQGNVSGICPECGTTAQASVA
jgi:hypothetical protein